MPGNAVGGAKAAKTNKNLYGKDFYQRIGAIGGAASRTGGFYGNPEAARKAGAVGGAKSRRTAGTPVSPEGRANMCRAQQQRRAKERFFIADTAEIGEDFTPSWRDRLLRRTR